MCGTIKGLLEADAAAGTKAARDLDRHTSALCRFVLLLCYQNLQSGIFLFQILHQLIFRYGHTIYFYAKFSFVVMKAG